MEISTQSGNTSKNSSGAIRWEQGTCNKSFKDEAQKIGQKNSCSNGQKVEFCTRIVYFKLLDEKSRFK